jgi:hypothetical protein
LKVSETKVTGFEESKVSEPKISELSMATALNQNELKTTKRTIPTTSESKVSEAAIATVAEPTIARIDGAKGIGADDIGVINSNALEAINRRINGAEGIGVAGSGAVNSIGRVGDDGIGGAIGRPNDTDDPAYERSSSGALKKKALLDKPYSLEKVFGSINLECLVNQEDIDLDEIARTKQEQRAAKSDDAMAPKYLWVEHLMSDGPTPWPEARRHSLPKAMATARQYLLRRWKVRLLREEFCTWIKLNCRFEVKNKHETSVEWRDGRYHWTCGGALKYKQHVMRLKIDGGRGQIGKPDRMR